MDCQRKELPCHFMSSSMAGREVLLTELTLTTKATEQ
jgi:hypothetical protein